MACSICGSEKRSAGDEYRFRKDGDVELLRSVCEDCASNLPAGAWLSPEEVEVDSNPKLVYEFNPEPDPDRKPGEGIGICPNCGSEVCDCD